MNQEDKLRDSLRKFYDNQAFPFDDQEWEQAQEMLRSARNERKRRIAIVLAFIFATTLFVSSLIFDSTKIEETKNLSQANKEKQVPVKQIAENKPSLELQNKIAAKKTFEQTKNESNKKDTNSPENYSISDESHYDSQVSTTINAEDTNSPSIKLNSKDLSEDSEKENFGIAIIPKNTNTINSETNAESESDHTNNIAPIPFTHPIVHASLASQVEKQEQSANLSTITSDNTEKETSDEKEIEQLNNTDSVINLEKEQSSELEKEITKLDTTEKSNLETIPDSLSLAENKLLQVYNGVFYELGLAWHYGWKGSNQTDARGFSPLIGINYMNSLNKRTAISFGVQYIQVRNLQESSKTSRESIYYYGEQATVTEITPTTLHYITAPLRFYYYLSQKQSIGLGLNIAYLLTVVADVEKHEEKPGFSGNYSTTTLSGYTEGFSWYDAQLTVFYRRNFRNNLGLHAEFFLGVTDVKQNDFFNLNKFERNSGLKIAFVYYAFRK